METILFLIIAGILSSIFGKAKGRSNPKQAKPFTVKGLNDRRLQGEQQKNNPKKPGQISTGQPVREETILHSLEEKYREIKEKPVIPIKQTTQPQKSNLFEGDSDVSLEKLDEKTIINGIIWAEILGEPRAKKPYFSEKR
ncbi:hypothetical protein [Neobacillus sp. DY30]|uniref:hypothetical protein n=1 Tax=Neobacillus sp. DY30 TaxID=3047871 RepID=UPI0024BF32F3|nr:hypothetical protein [Neobacillus sp. DY30]WHX99360.1 hypothetical protein QNH29_22645 [Neobacillus sp. DY30]